MADLPVVNAEARTDLRLETSAENEFVLAVVLVPVLDRNPD